MTKQKCSLTAKNVSAVSILFHHWLHARADMFFIRPAFIFPSKQLNYIKIMLLPCVFIAFRCDAFTFIFVRIIVLPFPVQSNFIWFFLTSLCIFCAFFIRNWFCCIRFGFLSIILMESDFFRHRQVLHRQHSTVRMSI